MLKRRKKVTILIPARLNSKRLPGKLLIEIQGLPIIEHVRRRAELNKHKAEVYVVSNDEKILKTVIENGGKTIRTYKKHLNGTSRCSEAAKLIKSDFFLILQVPKLARVHYKNHEWLELFVYRLKSVRIICFHYHQHNLYPSLNGGLSRHPLGKIS